MLGNVKKVKKLTYAIILDELLGVIFNFVGYRDLVQFRLVSKRFNNIIWLGNFMSYVTSNGNFLSRLKNFMRMMQVSRRICTRNNVPVFEFPCPIHNSLGGDHKSIIKDGINSRIHERDQMLILHLLIIQKVKQVMGEEHSCLVRGTEEYKAQFAKEHEKPLKEFAAKRALQFCTISNKFFNDHIFSLACTLHTRIFVHTISNVDINSAREQMKNLITRLHFLLPYSSFGIIFQNRKNQYGKLTLKRVIKYDVVTFEELLSKPINSEIEWFNKHKKQQKKQNVPVNLIPVRWNINYVEQFCNSGASDNSITKCYAPINGSVMDFLKNASEMCNLRLNPLLIYKKIREFLETHKDNLPLKSLIVSLKENRNIPDGDSFIRAYFIRLTLICSGDKIRFTKSDNELLNDKFAKETFLRICNENFYLLYEIVKANPNIIVTFMDKGNFLPVLIEYYQNLTGDLKISRDDKKNNAFFNFISVIKRLRVINAKAFFRTESRRDDQHRKFMFPLFEAATSVEKLILDQPVFLGVSDIRRLINHLINLKTIKVSSMTSAEFCKMIRGFTNRAASFENPLKIKIKEISVQNKFRLDKFVEALEKIENKDFEEKDKFFAKNRITFYGNFWLEAATIKTEGEKLSKLFSRMLEKRNACMDVECETCKNQKKGVDFNAERERMRMFT
jgi:hypothetical protein